MEASGLVFLAALNSFPALTRSSLNSNTAGGNHALVSSWLSSLLPFCCCSCCCLPRRSSLSMEMDSVVSLGYNSKFEGSGFVMFTSQPAFLVMTCEHVVGSYKSIQVTFPGKTKWYSAGVRWTDKDADLALLRFAPDGDCSRCAALQFADPNTTALNSGNVEMIAFHATSPGRLLYPGVFDGCITAGRW
uniref:Serine protease n=1 Tax=Hordeum vulgare subsp. vulgare TaxID=112509 RepID=M0VSZ1_HORVV